ncbi:MAG: ABC transporter permease [Pseudomonadota bacterium]
MRLGVFLLRRLIASVPLLVGVTFLSFLLMVFFGPDMSLVLAGKNPTVEEIEALRHSLGYDRPLFTRYASYLGDLVRLDLGTSIHGEPVAAILRRTVPVSVELVLPGFLVGNLLGLGVALVAARYRGRWPDRALMGAAVGAMSVSFLIVVIFAQLVFSSRQGLNLFPVQGWIVDSIGDYLYYVTVPTLALVFVTVGYNARFYRAVLVEELSRDYVRTARAYGASPSRVLTADALRNCAIPIVTRVVFSIPLVVISGSLVLEQYFGIPGIGEATHDAIHSGDQPVLNAVVALTAVAFVLVQTLADAAYATFDPRVTLR